MGTLEMIQEEREYEAYIKTLLAKEELTVEEEKELDSWSNDCMRAEFTIVGGF